MQGEDDDVIYEDESTDEKITLIPSRLLESGIGIIPMDPINTAA